MAVRPARLGLTESLDERVGTGTGHRHDRRDVGAWVGQVGHGACPAWSGLDDLLTEVLGPGLGVTRLEIGRERGQGGVGGHHREVGSRSARRDLHGLEGITRGSCAGT
jgi:hypothetical protein